MDNPGLYVAASRDRGNTILFGALDELEDERDRLIYGPPADQEALTARVIAALAEHASATATNANDRPVLADLDHLPGPGLGAQPSQPRAEQRLEHPVEHAVEQPVEVTGAVDTHLTRGHPR
jgi:hypothetical protein